MVVLNLARPYELLVAPTFKREVFGYQKMLLVM
jgi:hypothetical protein